VRPRLVRSILFAASLTVITAGCGGATTDYGVGPATARCQVGVASTPPTFPPSESSASVAITTARDCTWTAASEAAWVRVNPANGQGNGSVTISVAENAQTHARTASVVINDNPLAIMQDGMPCRYQLAPDELRVGLEGARTSVRVSTTDGCEWRASSNATWVRVMTERGAGTGSVELDVSRNEGAERSTTLPIAGLSLVVSQEGFSTGAPPGVPSPVPPPATCSYSIAPERASFRSPSGQGSIQIVTEPGCPWTASPQASWLSISRTTGTGPETLQYQVAANTSTTSERTGTLAVANRTHTVQQQACPLSIDPASQSFASFGGDGSIRITTDGGCQWSASSSADWLTLSRSSGSGPDSLRYVVGVYTLREPDRSATISVSGRTHTVGQTAFRPAEVSADGVLSNVGGSCPNFTFTVGGRVFMTDSHTTFDACDKVRNGVRAYVRGELLPDGRVLARQVDVDD